MVVISTSGVTRERNGTGAEVTEERQSPKGQGTEVGYRGAGRDVALPTRPVERGRHSEIYRYNYGTTAVGEVIVTRQRCQTGGRINSCSRPSRAVYAEALLRAPVLCG